MKPDGRRDFWITEFNVTFSVYFSLTWNGKRHNYLGFVKKNYLQQIYKEIVKVFVCTWCKNSLEYLKCLNFSKLENLSPLNPEIFIKNLYRLSRNCILSSGTSYFETPCISRQNSVKLWQLLLLLLVIVFLYTVWCVIQFLYNLFRSQGCLWFSSVPTIKFSEEKFWYWQGKVRSEISVSTFLSEFRVWQKSKGLPPFLRNSSSFSADYKDLPRCRLKWAVLLKSEDECANGEMNGDSDCALIPMFTTRLTKIYCG